MTSKGIKVFITENAETDEAVVNVVVDCFMQRPLPLAISSMITTEHAIGIIEDGVLTALGYENWNTGGTNDQ